MAWAARARGRAGRTPRSTKWSRRPGTCRLSRYCTAPARPTQIGSEPAARRSPRPRSGLWSECAWRCAQRLQRPRRRTRSSMSGAAPAPAQAHEVEAARGASPRETTAPVAEPWPTAAPGRELEVDRARLRRQRGGADTRAQTSAAAGASSFTVPGTRCQGAGCGPARSRAGSIGARRAARLGDRLGTARAVLVAEGAQGVVDLRRELLAEQQVAGPLGTGSAFHALAATA